MAAMGAEPCVAARSRWSTNPRQSGGRRHAMACVAALSQRMLDGGKEFCTCSRSGESDFKQYLPADWLSPSAILTL
jgi:hypothetical protein